MLYNTILWDNKFSDLFQETCLRKKIKIYLIKMQAGINKDILVCLNNILKKHLSDDC